MISIVEINRESWSDILRNSPYRTAFHNPWLIESFSQELNCENKLFFISRGTKSWLTPVYYDIPWVSNNNLFSTSLVGYGGPLALHQISEIETEINLINLVLFSLEEYLKKNFSGGTLYPLKNWKNFGSCDILETHILNLDSDVCTTFNRMLSGNVRTAIRKAEKNGITIKIIENDFELNSAHSLIVGTQRLVGAHYTTPFTLIKRLYDNKINNAEMFIALYADIIVGTVVLLNDNKHAFHWLHGWDRNYSKLCGNQLLIWNMIKYCIEGNSSIINLGACHTLEQKKAKERWGAITIPVFQIQNQ